MHIKRLSFAKGLGIFKNYSAVGDDANLAPLNLIYGFNGTGKTTLSRLFSSLEQGQICSMLPKGGRFEVELTDGSLAGSEKNLDRLKGKIAVFNTDFVEQKFKWKDGVANPVFYIGREQAALADELVRLQKKHDLLLVERDSEEKIFKRTDDTFTKFKRDTARNISEQVGNRTYNATHLDRDYASKRYDATLKLEESVRKNLRGFLTLEAPLPKIGMLDAEVFSIAGFAGFVNEVRQCLESSIGIIALSELMAHESMINWVSTGLHYHADNNLDKCLLCSGELTSKRVSQLKQSIDDKFDEFVHKIRGLLEVNVGFVARLELAGAKLPSKNDIIRVHSEAYAQACEVYQKTLEPVVSATASIKALLEEKLGNPTRAINPRDLCSVSEAEAFENSVAAHQNRLNDFIEEHNKAHDAFAANIANAQKRLREHYLHESEARYRELEKQMETATTSLERARAAASGSAAKINGVKQLMRQHGPAAEAI